MKYLRKFETDVEKSAWRFSDEYVKPNVVLVGGMVEYNVLNPAEIPMYIEALEDLVVKFSRSAYEYSKDNNTWNSGTNSINISATAGERVYLRANGLTANSTNGIGRFTISNGACNVGGNAMSLVYGSDYKGKVEIAAEYQFYNLFENGEKIIDASELILPATTLVSNCYQNMFRGCANLVNAPALPATTLVSTCYQGMFYGCTNLVNAPALPATTLANSCYRVMFRGCTNLVNAPALPATTLADSCYLSMFKGCTSLVNAPALPATTFSGAYYSYESMFMGCSNLSYVKAMFKITPGSSFTENWLSGVAATGTFVKNAAATWDVTGVNGIPEGWTVETAEA